MRIAPSTETSPQLAPARTRPAAASPGDRPVVPAAAAGRGAARSEEIDEAIAAANRFMQKLATNLKFEKDMQTGRIVVRVIDSQTSEVLRQMPSEEMLAMSRALDRVRGVMLNRTA